MASKKQYDEEIQRLLKSVVDIFDEEEKPVRQRQIRTWRRLKLLWEGFRNTYFNDVAHDWRIPEPQIQQDDNNQAYYDKPINVYRAYLESIIAALSVTVPPVKCYPEDADDPMDLLTARAGDQISKKIYDHNDVSLLWLHALFVYCTEGMVACYHYSHSDKEYGQYEESITVNEEEEHEYLNCPNCGYTFEDNIVTDEMMTGMPEEEMCPECGEIVNPEIQRVTETISKLLRKEFKDKTRQCIEAYGGLFVKIPNNARKQSECPYLGYEYETHYVNVINDYPHLYEKLQGKPQGVYDPYDAWGRLSPQYIGMYPQDNVTCRDWWIRPHGFDVLPKEDSDKLKRLFPEGVLINLVNEDFADACPCKLDDNWTLTYNPLSDYLNHDPLGLLLVSVQEITNDLISLTLQTIEHGIGQTFVDPQTLNFDQYRQTEVAPGDIFPAKAKAGKSMSDSFYEIKTATLSQEVMPFGTSIQQLGQLASGAQPAIFGGQLEENKTASGYAMSRAQSLQRLQNTWKMFTVWWEKIFAKVIPAYIETVYEDEKDVQYKDGNFINVFIRKSDLEGKIGKVKLEANENLPITWSQRKEQLFELLQTNNEKILEILGSPENLPVMREALGLENFYIPGEDDRNKQYEEIKLLLQSTPIVMPPTVDPMMAADPMMANNPEMMAAMQPQELPSVGIEADIDNDDIHFEICRAWLVSDAGRLAKIENNEGYNNVVLHAKMHLQRIQELMMMQQAQMAEQEKGAVPGEKPNETEKEAPIQNEGDVNATA